MVRRARAAQLRSRAGCNRWNHQPAGSDQHGIRHASAVRCSVRTRRPHRSQGQRMKPPRNTLRGSGPGRRFPCSQWTTRPNGWRVSLPGPRSASPDGPSPCLPACADRKLNASTGRKCGLSADTSRSRPRRARQGRVAWWTLSNLAVILEPLAGSGRVFPHSPKRAEEWARQSFGRPLPKNVARHSFVSYHLALFGDIASTELQAGHDRAVMFQHYRELVTRQDAESYFSITV